MKNVKDRMSAYIDGASAKISNGFWRVVVLGVLAGAFIALAGVASTFAKANALDGRLASACVFPFGLIMVVISGSELFTGDCLLIAPLVAKKINVGRTLLFLLTVYLSNFVGSVAVSALAVYSGVLKSAAETAVNIAATKSAMTFGQAFLAGVGCNFLVCVAVWMANASDNLVAKAVACYVPIFLFVYCGFEHSVANMYYLPTGLMANAFYAVGKTLSVGDMLVRNLLPVTLGNVVGGFAVGLGYYVVAKQ